MGFDYLKISSKFRKIAASTEHHPNWMMPTMASALRQIEKYGYTLRKKRPGSFSETMTTTDVVTKTIWLRVGWDTRPPERNVATLYHELVHVGQGEDWGPMLFGLRYGSPRWRWAIEMQAYAVSIEVARSLGGDISGMPEAIAKSLVSKYKPWFPVSEEEIRTETIACLRKV